MADIPDPFKPADSTVIRPRPGGGRRPAADATLFPRSGPARGVHVGRAGNCGDGRIGHGAEPPGSCGGQELPLVRFGGSPFHAAARAYALFHLVQNIVYTHASGTEWIERYVVQERQWDYIRERMDMDPSPFVLMLAGSLFVRVVPVPLNSWRLWSRRFNQSAMLAHGVGQLARVPVDCSALARVRQTISQVGLSPDQRRRNVAGAFKVPKARASAIKDKKIVVIDDVITTGATAEACARVLRRAGAARVDVLALARAVEPTANTLA